MDSNRNALNERNTDMGREFGRRFGSDRRGPGAYGPSMDRRRGFDDFTVEDILTGQLRACSHFLHFNTGVKFGQQRILTTLLADGRMTQRELQDILGVRSGSLSEILNKVEAEGYVRRSQNETDRRQMNLDLTEAGREEAGRLEEQQGRMTQGLFAALSDEEKEQLKGLLEKLLESWYDGHGRRLG